MDRPAFLIREATPEDNEALLALDRQWVMAAAVLDQFRPLQLHFTLFGLDLRGAGTGSLGSRLVFIDPADL